MCKGPFLPHNLMYAQSILLGEFECSVLTGTRPSQIAQLSWAESEYKTRENVPCTISEESLG
jgi:hypothetical protein